MRTFNQIDTSKWRQYTQATTQFYGLNRGMTVIDGEMNDMENLTSDYFPQMAPCLPRVTGHMMLGGTYRGSIAKGTDIYSVCGGRLYKNGEWVEAVELEDCGNLEDDHKLMVGMGAQILIWPDKIVYNTITGEVAHMGNKWQASGEVSLSPCTLNGTLLADGKYTVSDTKPSSPANGDYWYDTKSNLLMIYASSAKAWQQVNSTYIRMEREGIGNGFKLNDAVYLGSTAENKKLVFVGDTPDDAEVKSREVMNDMLGSSYVVYAVEDDYVVITGLICADLVTTSITLERRVPDFSHVCEANNRIWGCQYGESYSMDGSYVNQLMACALGDPMNWETYDQVSTDSYAVSLGSDGPFTGGIALNGVPCFFKEGVLTRISGSTPTQFSTEVTGCRGVDAGDGRSLCRIEQSLIYKGLDDVLMYNNSQWQSIGEKLGKTTLSGNTIASTVHGLKYCLLLPDGLYVYDYAKGLWHR